MIATIHPVFPSLAAVLGLPPALFSPEITQVAGSMLFTAIWQGAVVAILLGCFLKIARGTSPAIRFQAWVVGFFAAIGLPFLPFLIHGFAGLMQQSAVNVAASSPAPSIQLDIRWSLAIALVWAVASCWRTIDLAIHAIRLRRLWKSAQPIDESTPGMTLISSANPAPWGRKRVELCTTHELDRPGVIGFFAPRILIPEWLFERLTTAELEQIVLHETAHLRRGDDWTNLLQKLMLVLFPLNPALLWMDRQLCLEREMACDEEVVRATRSPRAYATCLTSLAEHGRAWRRNAVEQTALTLGAWRRRSELVRRVHRILSAKNGAAYGPLRARAVFAVLVCALGVGTVEMARCPQLIAFVPARREQARPLRAQVHPEHFQNAIAMPAQAGRAFSSESGNDFRGMKQTVGTAGAVKPYMRNLKAIMPGSNGFVDGVHGDIQNTERGRYLKFSRRFKSQSVRDVEQTAAARSINSQIASLEDSMASARGPLEPQAGDSGLVADQESAQQGWLVLTTWEEVTSTQAQVETADTQQTVAVSTDSPKQIQPAQPPAAEIRFTRVIFRVIPAGFVSSAPTAAKLRDGWLVLQL
jgi:beta-lactamase regulating signal transducer with metallopeptidase domain